MTFHIKFRFDFNGSGAGCSRNDETAFTSPSSCSLLVIELLSVHASQARATRLPSNPERLFSQPKAFKSLTERFLSSPEVLPLVTLT